jgi:uncharacterized protein YfaS (alpha-2-macroglobulin family)
MAVPASASAPGGAGEPTPADRRELPLDSGAALAKLSGLAFSLRDGPASTPSAAVGVREARSEPLPSDAAARLLARLPPLEAEHEPPFALRTDSLPPPQKAKTVAAPFPPPRPPPGPAPAVAGRPLEVLRHQPDGAVALAAKLAVTFSEPMVPVGAVESLSGSRPVKLSPEPPGKWRWIGTRTLLFEPSNTLLAGASDRAEPSRFPMATSYRVRVPKGTRSVTGAVLDDEVSWTFETPPPAVRSFQPEGGPHPLQPVMVAVFDQAIDPAAALKTTHAASAGKEAALRLATAEEIEKDPAAKSTLKSAAPGRTLAFRSVEPFPPAAEVTLTLGPGTPSREGKATSKKAATYRFKTYEPLRVTAHGCGAGGACPLGSAFTATFNNPLDPAAFEAAAIKVQPAIPGLEVNPAYSMITVQGRMTGRTRYVVTLPSTLRDVYGQTLGKDVALDYETGSAWPLLAASGGELVVLDPGGKPSLSIDSTNHQKLELRVWVVRPEDYPAFARGGRPGTLVHRGELAIGGPPDARVETAIELSPYLKKSGLGHLVVEVKAPPVRDAKGRPEEGPAILKWIQSTRIGLDAFVDGEELLARTTDLATGAALEGVAVSIGPGAGGLEPRRSDARGLATIALRPAPAGAPPDDAERALLGRIGDDVAFLPDLGAHWHKANSARSLSFYVFDDRALYRPGESVHVKGWLRPIDFGKNGDLSAWDRRSPKVDYQLRDAMGNTLGKGSAKIGALGGFDLETRLPDTVNLGRAELELSSAGGSFHHDFEVEEFRRPEFEVSVAVESGPHLVGRSSTAAVRAAYYAGGGLPGAEVRWVATAHPASFVPPNQGDFVFGAFVPWWRARPEEGGFGSGFGGSGRRWGRPMRIRAPEGESVVQSWSGKTDSDGTHHLELDFSGVNPPRAMGVSLRATVMDVNRQAWSAAASLLVHPAEIYVGLKVPRPFVLEGEPIRIDAIAVDLDGKALPGRAIELSAGRRVWRNKRGAWVEEEVDPKRCLLTSAESPVRCEFTPGGGGSYKVRATVADARGRKNETELLIWVAGAGAPPPRELTRQSVELIPDQKRYAVGDTAKLFLAAPFTPADGILTVRRSGIVEVQHFRVSGASAVLEVPIREAYLPNVTVQVDLTGSATAAENRAHPAYASGNVSLSIPPLARRLTVNAKPTLAALEPGASTTVRVQVADANGAPVKGAEVALVVVDEAVLALSGYRLPDPLEWFHPARAPGVIDESSRSYVVLARSPSPDNSGVPPDIHTRAPSIEGAGRASLVKRKALRLDTTLAVRATETVERDEPIAVRSDFAALALFAPSVETGADGAVEVPLKVPDNLTRYRITAVAVAGGKLFGLGESSLTARKLLMVRPSPPRFLDYGDAFELPVVVQNQSREPLSVDLAIRTTPGLVAAHEGASPAGRRITVPAEDRLEVRFPLSAERVGRARFQVVGAAGRLFDAAEQALPIWTPASSEAFATYGEIDQGAVLQPIATPKDAVPSFGGLEVSASSTEVQELTDAVLDLVSYPFECSEQLASRVIAVAALKDVLNAFEAPGIPPAKAVLAAVDRDLEKLEGMQNSDGGLPFWKRGQPSWPFNTIHAAHAMARAKAKKLKVPEYTLGQTQVYLRNIERRFPAEYGRPVRQVLTAYALYVRALLGEPDRARAKRLIEEFGGVDRTPLESLGWLYAVLIDDPGSATELAAIRKSLMNRVSEEAGTAHFASASSEVEGHLVLHTDRRADAILLEALIRDQPNSDLVPKLVRGLLGSRREGRWASTQEDVWVLLALGRYFETFEKTPPNFVARVWLGQGYRGEHRFRSRSTEIERFAIPMPQLSSSDLVLEKDGPGRMYYRVGLRYAPKSLELSPDEHGFVVERRYEAVDAPDDVRRDADGDWHVKAGARVRVRLTMVAESVRYHVALVDPLPAGLEAINPALAVADVSPTPPGPGSGPRPSDLWFRPWYEHQNLLDERVEAFTTWLWEGVHDYEYVARATTPGRFIVPPAKAEEMYHPETFGRTGTARLVVDP